MRLRPLRLRTIAVLVVMGTLLLASLSSRFYQLTDPFSSAVPIYVFRKLESVVTFALVGALVGPSWWRSALAVGLFSAAIETAQHLHGTAETAVQSAFDIVLGIGGGAAGAAFRRRLMRSGVVRV